MKRQRKKQKSRRKKGARQRKKRMEANQRTSARHNAMEIRAQRLPLFDQSTPSRIANSSAKMLKAASSTATSPRRIGAGPSARALHCVKMETGHLTRCSRK